MKPCFRRWCLRTICSYCSNLIFCVFQNTDSKSRHSDWNMFFLPERSSELQDLWLWDSQQNIRIRMCMKYACRNKMVSNIPVLASVCFTRHVYPTQYSALQEWFVKFSARWCRKSYIIGSFPKFLHQMKVNEDDFILSCNSGLT